MIAVSYPNEKKIKKIFLEVISNIKIFNIKILFNDFSNKQDYVKLTEGLKKRTE